MTSIEKSLLSIENHKTDLQIFTSLLFRLDYSFYFEDQTQLSQCSSVKNSYIKCLLVKGRRGLESIPIHRNFGNKSGDSDKEYNFLDDVVFRIGHGKVTLSVIIIGMCQCYIF